jgi:hypothetical protein
LEISTYSESVENDKMEASINDDWLSEYMAFVVDPVIFEKDNLIRLGYDPETMSYSRKLVTARMGGISWRC